MRDTLTCVSEAEFAVEFVADLLPNRFDAVARHLPVGNSLLISTPTVWSLHGARMAEAIRTQGIDLPVRVMKLDEASKTMRSVEQVCAAAHDHGVGRRGMLVAFGGGVCSDVVGFAASTLRRGVGHLRIPTTLIGQIDAGIGIKTGVNFGRAKNYLGTFHPPLAVVVDPAFLTTLPAGGISEGLAEIVKIALVRDVQLFEMIEAHGERLIATRFAEPAAIAGEVLRRSSALMLEELQLDPFERGTLQRLVDMGHTFSPALEAASDYSISHGRAVAIDMALSSLLGARLGLCSRGDAQRVVRVLQQLGLPIYSEDLTTALGRSALEAAALHRNGKVNLVVPEAIGRAVFIADAAAIDDSLLDSVLDDLAHFGDRVERAAAPRALAG